MSINSEQESNIIEAPQKRKSGSILGIFMFLILLFAISIIALSVYLKSEGYDFKTLSIKDAINYLQKNNTENSTTSMEISYSQDGSVDCKMYKDYIIILSKDGIKWYDMNGKLVQDKAMTLAQPVLRTSDKYMAVVDISGRDILFYKDKTLLWQRKLDNQIVNADISDDGYCSVVTQSKEYTSIVQVIDINGVDKYSKLYADDIILSAKAIHDGQDVLINKVGTDNIKAGTQFEFNSIFEEKPYATINVLEKLLPILMSLGNNEVGIGDNVIVFMNKEGKEVWRKGFDSIFCVALDSDKYIIAAGQFTNTSGETKQQIAVINTKGEIVYSFDQPENIVGMDMHGDRLALRTQRSIYVYSLKGKKLGQYSAKNEIKDAYLVGDNEAIVISGATISKVSTKKTN